MNLNVHTTSDIATVFSQVKGAEVNKFSGPHPASCVGVQIHHIDPISKGDIVWTINPFGVIQIGKLFLNGVYDASKIVAVVGSEVKAPQYYKTVTSASIKNWLPITFLQKMFASFQVTLLREPELKATDTLVSMIIS